MSVESMQVKPGCEATESSMSLTILVNATNPTDFSAVATRNRVVQFARKNGLPNASGLSGIPSCYPIDDNGETHDDMLSNKKPFTHWQAEYTVNATI